MKWWRWVVCISWERNGTKRGGLTISYEGAQVASRGTNWLLWFLSLISANLAVVNFLPIPVVDGGLPVCEQLAEEVISLPMHAYLEPAVQNRVIAAVRRALTR